MKNFEKYEKEIMEITNANQAVAVVNGIPSSCCKTVCSRCDFEHGWCNSQFVKWLYKEVPEAKPRLNRYERAFCEALQTGWIAKNKSEGFSVYEEKPKKMEDYWYGAGYFTNTATIRHINPKIRFSFINWEDAEPWSVSALLELEVEE